MTRKYPLPGLCVCVALLPGGCSRPAAVQPGAAAARVLRVQPGDAVQEEAQRALIEALPGDTVEFAAGTFAFTRGLSLRKDGVTVRGQGIDRTILSFKNQEADPAGLYVKADGFTVEDLTVEDTAKDGIKVEGGTGVAFRRVRARWGAPGNATNGPYGIYPVQCTNVLVEDCVATGASDAGIYVGQSRDVIVRRCRAEGNVAGIEIENSTDVDVYENTATDNAGGLLVFDLPGLPVKNGRRIRVFQNEVYANNHANFAPAGVKVAKVASGTGMMVMATDQVELFRNTIRDNQTVNLAVVSYVITDDGTDRDKDPDFDPYPEGIFIHDNRFAGGGDRPAGRLGLLFALLLGKPLPDIVYDGVRAPGAPAGTRLLALRDNGAATFADLQWAELLPALRACRTELELPLRVVAHRPKVRRDPKAFEGNLPPLPPVQLPGGPR
jgi:parallel beta-helix repeat protein